MRAKTRSWRVWAGIGAVLIGVTATTGAAAPAKGHQDLGPGIDAILAKPAYQHSQWGILEQDPETGRTIHDLQGGKFFIPGSVAKLFSVSGTWDTLGGDHRFTTPVNALGSRSGSVLNGNLAMVAQGDLTMGGRTKPDGTVDFTPIDRTYANDVPGATLTPEDPLAGLNSIAQQVRSAGISQVRGNVAVDPRLFTA